MKMKDKIKKSIINIILIVENDNYRELINFSQIDNYCEPKGVYITIQQDTIILLTFVK